MRGHRLLVRTATTKSLVSLMIAVSLAVVCLAAEDPVFDAPGIQRSREFFSQASFENIDTLTGSLVLSFTDLVIPGNAGSEMRFVRTYNSKNSTWTFGIAGVVSELFLGDDSVPIQSDHRDPDSYLRHFRTADGGDRSMKWMQPFTFSDPQSFRFTVSEEFLRYDRTTQVLYYPDGRRSTFEFVAGFGRVKEVVDTFGNKITFTRTADSLVVTQTLNGSGSRDVTFAIDPETQQPTSMEFNGKIWRYAHDQPGRRLSAVTPPAGPGWTYRYESDRAELTHVGLPAGGSIDYTYQTHQFARNVLPGVSILSRVVTSRRTWDRINQPQEWTYDYFDSQGGDRTETQVKTRDIRITYVHQFSVIADGMVFASKKLERQSGSSWIELQSEARDYQGIASIAKTYVPSSRSVTRNGRTYYTQYFYSTEHNADYNRPRLIVESGDFGVARTIKYDHDFPNCFSGRPDFGPCILAPTSQEKIDDGLTSSVTDYTYNHTTGFKETATVDGVRQRLEPAGDSSGNAEVIRDGLDNPTTISYTWGVASSIVTRKTTTTREVRADSLVWSETQRGFTTEFDYDDAFRVKKVKPSKGNEVITEYAPDGTWKKVTRGASSLRTEFDGFGQPTGTANSLGIRTSTSYDSEGRKTFESLPYTGASVGDRIEYDALGRVTKRRHADDSEVTWDYQPGSNGYDVQITDEEHRVTVQHWTATGDPAKARLAGVRDPDGKEWKYKYQVTGALAEVTAPETPGSPASNIAGRRWTLNGQNQLETEANPESGTTTYGPYDPAGNLVNKRDPFGTLFTYIYDADNRLEQIKAEGSRGTQITKIGYEDNSNLRETVEIVGGALVFFHYDAAGRLDERTETVHGKKLITRYVYEGDDLDTIKYPSGRVVEYRYNTEGQPSDVRDVTQPGHELYYARGARYHPGGGLESYTSGNDLVHNQQFDSQRYWPTRIDVGSLLSIDYQNYDRAGNVRHITTNHGGPAPRTINEDFTYDALDRLSTMNSQNGGYGFSRFDYDVHGNRLTNAYGNYDYYPGTLRLAGHAGETYCYDANGNLTTVTHADCSSGLNVTAKYSYRPDNMPSRAETQGRDTSYEYDGDQFLRVARAVRDIVANVQETSLYSYGPAGQLLGEYRDSEGAGFSPLREYIYLGSKLIADVAAPIARSSTVSVHLKVTTNDPLGDFAQPASLKLEATASTTDGIIDRVEFYRDGSLVGRFSASSAQMNVDNLLEGVYKFSAKAVNTAGRSATDETTIRIIRLGRVGAITVEPAHPLPGQVAVITVDGSNPCGALQLNYGDGTGAPVLPIVDVPASFTHIWAEDGIFTITVQGHGNCRGLGTKEIIVGTPNAPPTVTLVQPPAGISVPAGFMVPLSATASDPDGSIARVEFYANADLIASVTAAPYEASWPASTPGVVTIKAVAYDNRGKSAQATAAITVAHLSGVTVAPATIQANQSATVTVTGLSSCGAVQIDYGDGTIITYPLSGLPMSQVHTWTTAGARMIVAQGQGNCLGTFATTLTVTANAPPTVSLTAPAAGASFVAPASIAFAATAADSDGTIARVEFYAGATLVGTDTTAPYSITWPNAAAGSYSLTAKAYDNAGASTVSAPVSVTVTDLAAVTVSPSPIQQGLAGTVTVTGSATCGAVQIDYGDGTVVTYPISGLPLVQTHTWGTAGTKTIVATGQGNCLGQRSASLTVTANNPPSVSLTAPANGAVYIVGQTVTLSATASDSDGTVARVEFYAGAILVGTDTTAPYSVTWPNAASGSHMLTAKAYDNASAATVSTGVAITVTDLAAVSVSPSPIQQGQSGTVTVTGSATCGAVQIDYGDGTVVTYAISGLPFAQVHAWSGTGTKTVVATGQGNCAGQRSTTVNVTANAAPSVSLTSPANGAVYIVGQSVTLSATASDSDGTIARVDFLDGGSVIGSAAAAPYSLLWTPSAGAHGITARAVDNANATATSAAATITVRHLSGVSVTPGSIQQGLPATVTVTGSSACGAVQIDYGDGTVITYALSGLPASQTHAWSTAGVKTVTATGQGNCTGTVTGTVTVTANNPPSVSLTAPSNGAVYIIPNSVTLTATASDSDGSIARVEFLNGGTVIGTVTSTPYTMTWSPGAGTYAITARAVDNGNVSTTTAAANITVRHVAGVSVSPGSVQQGVTATVTVTGSASCGAIQIDYGDGTVITYPLSGLPTSQTHAWAAQGTKTITATGQGNCTGTVTGTATVVTNNPPSVSLTSPANGATVIVGQSVTLTATASDSDGSIARVEFLSGGSVIGTDTTAPYSMTWTPGAGTYAIAARAVDNGNVTTTTAAANITVKDVGSVSVSPASVQQGVTATVTVTGSTSCGAVQINYGDGTVITYPLSGLPTSQTHVWPTQGVLTVTATGQGNCVGTASANVTVVPNNPPSVGLTSPTNGSGYTVGQSVTLTATASDSDGAINRVEFLNGGSIIGTDTSAPYSITWTPGAGTYSISARAVDNGNVSNTSGVATITVSHVSGVAVSPSSVVPSQPATVTVAGSSSCGAVQINYGDGTVITYPLSGLPTSQAHTWPSPGVWTITATGQGNCVGTATGSVTVVANAPPMVALTAPGSAVWTTGTALTLSANASDAHGVARVEFYAGGALVGTDYDAPYAVGWNVVSGSVAVFARAYDSYGAYADSAAATETGRDIDPRMSLDAPANGAVTGQPMLIGGWAVDLGAPSGTGVSTIHVYAAPVSGAPWIFLGASPYGGNRPDLAATLGEQFRYSGFTMMAGGLDPGTYTIVAYAYSTVTASWSSVRYATITIPTPNVLVAIDAPGPGQTVGQPFGITGWAIDLAHPTESGVSFLHVYAHPADGSAPIYLGAASTGGSRPDVGAAYGARFTPSGWYLAASGLPAGSYTIAVYPWSTVTQGFRWEAVVTRSVYVAW